MTGSFQSKDSYNAFIRCCSVDGTECTTVTANCKEPTYATTYDDAVSQCESQGLRLCTKNELLTDVCCGTGGGCDSYAIWTSTSAGKLIYLYPLLYSGISKWKILKITSFTKF